MKKALSLLLAAVLLISALPAAVFAADAGYKGKTVIVYTGNIRGNLDVYPKIARARKDYQARGADVILADAGNYLQGSAAANYDRGLTVYSLMDAAGYDVAGMGLAEFSYAGATTGYPYHGNLTRYYTQAMLQNGTEEISYNRDREGKVTAVLPAKAPAGFKTVCSNVAENEAYSFAGWTDVKTENGLTVRFLGIADPAAAGQVQDGYVAAVEPAAPQDGFAGVTVLLSNAPEEITGLSHAVISVPAGGPLTAAALVIDNDTREFTVESLDLDSLEDDPQVAALVKAAKARDIPVLGRSEVVLEGRDSQSRNRETNLGDFTCDALKWYAETYIGGMDSSLPVVAIQNGGNCDQFLYAGDVTEVDLLNALPFSPMGIGVLQVTGAQLLETIEAAGQRADSQGFAQVAGLTYTLDAWKEYDAGAPYGSYFTADSVNRVTITSVGGKPFEPAASYNLVCDNFLINGNDTYYTLKAAREAPGAVYINNGAGVKTRDAAALYIKEALGGTIGAAYARPQGRITVTRFSDVRPADYFFTPAHWAVEQGITSGTSATTFGPEQPCTRAQAITFLWNAAGRPEPRSASCPFSDVPRGAYYEKAATWAAEQLGAMLLFGVRGFEPDRTVTRSEVIGALWIWAGRPAVNSATGFSDVSGSDWYDGAVRWAAAGKITSGTSAATFGPGDPCTRAQVMTFLYQYAGL